MQLAPGRSGYHASRHYDRHARCVAVGDSASYLRSLARIAPRDYTPLGKSRGGTPEGEPSPSNSGTVPHGQMVCADLRKLVCDVRRLRLRVFPAFHNLSFIGETAKRRDTTRPTTPRSPFCSRFALQGPARRALHVAEIGCPARRGVCGNEEARLTSPRRAGRGRRAKRGG